MAQNDVYQIKLSGTLYGKAWSNVFYYRWASGSLGGTPAQTLAGEFDADVWEEIRGIQDTTVTGVQIEVINLATPSDFYLRTPTNPGGSLVGEAPPAFFSASFRANRAGPGTRYSFKRICGPIEADIEGEGLVSGAAARYLAVETALGADLVNGATWQPVQVKRPVFLFANPTVNYVADTWSFQGWTTQSSRK